MDKQVLFLKFFDFITSVHQTTHAFSKGAKLEDVTPVQYKMLEYVAVSQPVTLSSIADCTHMSLPNTSREIKKLMQKGLCEKVADTDDRRKQLIRLSEKGQQLMNGIFGHMLSQLEGRIGTLSDEKLKEIEQALDLLHDQVFRA
ncbi:MarR family transcriptional regulator [Cohnella ginsengisoli]|uniref:MarR family transcriptional regulator n=1 Tax=Cohnella ginsengisoli TaxID=425004 RepID=A0A9X4KFW1_9BACL|nr:MarR family transcriptional regulator [Cohnella ginsengisoli]MDG0791378.1 MarR family transcriptional regulator [Cohnella ginsengisoli]